MSQEYNALFPKTKDLGHRDWGRELLLSLVPGWFTLKRIEMKKGTKGGLQFHRKKIESGVLIEGECIVRYAYGPGLELLETHCSPGDVFHFPAGTIHQIEAVTACVYIEASTPYFNDRVHVEHAYGLPEAGGLPSTEEHEITLA